MNLIRDIINEKKDYIVLFVSAWVIYAIQSLGWPLAPGRDFVSYIDYFVGIWYAEPTYQMLMLYRTPVTPLFIGVFYFLCGSVMLEFIMGLLFSVAIMATYYIGSCWSKKTALIASVTLLLYPGYGALYHDMASDSLFAFGSILWFAFVSFTAKNPTLRNFILNSFFVFLLVLTRPIALLFIIFLGFPFILPYLTSKQKISRSLAFMTVLVALLSCWSLYNYIRYNDFTVSRGAGYMVPFRRLFIGDRIVKPENGPASQALADAVSKDLLTHEPYKSYGIDLETFFNPPHDKKNSRCSSDLVSLSDRTWGWDSDHKVLRKVAIEAILTHPDVYLKNTYILLVELFTADYQPKVHTISDEVSNRRTRLNEKGLPVPTENQLTPYSYVRSMASNDKNEIISEDKLEKFKQRKHGLHLDKIELPIRNGISDVATLLNSITRLFPKMNVLFFLGFLIFLFPIPEDKITQSRVYLIFSIIAILTVVVICFIQRAPVQARIPLDPIFFLLGVSFLERCLYYNKS